MQRVNNLNQDGINKVAARTENIVRSYTNVVVLYGNKSRATAQLSWKMMLSFAAVGALYLLSVNPQRFARTRSKTF